MAVAAGREVAGPARLGRRTKRLVKELRPGAVAVLDHKDLDRVSAEDLIAAGVLAVLNCSPSSTGAYPNMGPLLLVQAGIHLVDLPDDTLFSASTTATRSSSAAARCCAATKLLASGDRPGARGRARRDRRAPPRDRRRARGVRAEHDKLPDPAQDVAKAKDLIKQAGASGKTITLGMTTEVAQLNTAANAIRSAGAAIGLKGDVQGRLGAELHQLLHRPQGARGNRNRLPDRQLPRLRRPGRLLQHDRDAGRQPELRRVRRPGDHEGDEQRPLDGRPGAARGVRRRGRRPDHAAAAVDPDGGDQHDADHVERPHRRARVLSRTWAGRGRTSWAARAAEMRGFVARRTTISSRRCSCRASSSSGRWTSRRATRCRR